MIHNILFLNDKYGNPFDSLRQISKASYYMFPY